MTVSIAALLAQADLPESSSPRLDAELLLAHALAKPRSFLRTWPERQVPAEQRECFETLLRRRREGQPIAYLLGRQGFWNLELEVAPSTLIPRADTETLVEVALSLPLPADAQALDLGTGTGAIALALGSERPAWRMTGLDRIPEAVELARANATRLGIDKVRFQRSDWFAELAAASRFDLIVSNPPYIAEGDLHLGQGDVRFEPVSALVSGPDGLRDIRQIVAQAPDFLFDAGWLLLEHGWDQAADVRALLEQRGFEEVRSWSDLGAHERVSGGLWHA